MSIASLGNINLDGITAENPGGYQGKPLVVTVSLHPGPEHSWVIVMQDLLETVYWIEVSFYD